MHKTTKEHRDSTARWKQKNREAGLCVSCARPRVNATQCDIHRRIKMLGSRRTEGKNRRKDACVAWAAIHGQRRGACIAPSVKTCALKWRANEQGRTTMNETQDTTATPDIKPANGNGNGVPETPAPQPQARPVQINLGNLLRSVLEIGIAVTGLRGLGAQLKVEGSQDLGNNEQFRLMLADLDRGFLSLDTARGIEPPRLVVPVGSAGSNRIVQP